MATYPAPVYKPPVTVGQVVRNLHSESPEYDSSRRLTRKERRCGSCGLIYVKNTVVDMAHDNLCLQQVNPCARGKHLLEFYDPFLGEPASTLDLRFCIQCPYTDDEDRIHDWQ
jgi:hypothetical protein